MTRIKSHRNHTIHKNHQELSYEDEIVIPEDIYDLEDFDSHRERSIFHKLMVFLLGLFLVVLMISYIFAGFPLSGIIRGQLESSPLENNMVEVSDDLILIFENGTHEQIKELYFSEQKNEFSLCLLGSYNNIGSQRIYSIDSLYQPTHFIQTFNHVSFEPCSSDTLILFHTHPYKSCLASNTDLETLEKTKSRNPNTLMVVMCEPNRFSVYG